MACLLTILVFLLSPIGDALHDRPIDWQPQSVFGVRRSGIGQLASLWATGRPTPRSPSLSIALDHSDRFASAHLLSPQWGTMKHPLRSSLQHTQVSYGP